MSEGLTFCGMDFLRPAREDLRKWDFGKKDSVKFLYLDRIEREPSGAVTVQSYRLERGSRGKMTLDGKPLKPEEKAAAESLFAELGV